MSISHEEFRRLLPMAVGGTGFSEVDGSYQGGEGRKTWAIQLFRMPDRPLGRVRLTRHRVEITFEGHSDQEVDAFMAQFHRGFLRGGG